MDELAMPSSSACLPTDDGPPVLADKETENQKVKIPVVDCVQASFYMETRI
jgi:hypothetical protein